MTSVNKENVTVYVDDVIDMSEQVEIKQLTDTEIILNVACCGCSYHTCRGQDIVIKINPKQLCKK
jgi:hypothetical protein